MRLAPPIMAGMTTIAMAQRKKSSERIRWMACSDMRFKAVDIMFSDFSVAFNTKSKNID